MDESKAALVKKIGEGNKSLSVIVAEDKLAKFKRFSQNINLSMGYLLNQAIDRYLAHNSTEIFSTSTGIPTSIGTNITSATVQTNDMEELVNTTIKAYLLNNSIGSLTKTDVEELVNTTIENKLSKSSIGIEEVKELIKTSIDDIEVEQLVKAQIEPLADLLTELETYTQKEFKAVREELKKPLANAPAHPQSDRVTSISIPTITPTTPKTVRDNEPEWVNAYNRRFYIKLVNDSELLSKVAEVIPQYPKDNSALAAVLVEVGLSKVDGTAFDSASISRIKKVVECLNP
jgi:predicted house-cleaning noncanonical NTP pyrophosphatase (MazG superfamily)